DGSNDKTEEIISNLCGQDKKLKLINLKKNMGQTAALSAGFHRATGEYIITIDADLQNDPNDIPTLLNYLEAGSYDIVSGHRANRKDAFITRTLPSKIANKLIALLSGVKLNDFGCTLKIYKKEILKGIHLYGDMHRFIPALASWQGAKIGEIPVNHRARKYGKSKYGLARIFKVTLDLMIIKFMGSYSTRPLHFFGGAGLISIFFSFLCGVLLIYLKLAKGESIINSPLLHLASLLFLIGFQSILMGLLAEIMTRTYFESQNKPIYFIRDTKNLDEYKNS
ncbi:MAG: glycosyltransferase family 2 protein, partial [Planctomycetes bacterium]|nr:glycosyltransferase family 2 protein [Planctomycetota bacterium]